MIGVTLTRQNGALRELAEADPERILDVLGPAGRDARGRALTPQATSSPA